MSTSTTTPTSFTQALKKRSQSNQEQLTSTSLCLKEFLNLARKGAFAHIVIHFTCISLFITSFKRVELGKRLVQTLNWTILSD